MGRGNGLGRLPGIFRRRGFSAPRFCRSRAGCCGRLGLRLRQRGSGSADRQRIPAARLRGAESAAPRAQRTAHPLFPGGIAAAATAVDAARLPHGCSGCGAAARLEHCAHRRAGLQPAPLRIGSHPAFHRRLGRNGGSRRRRADGARHALAAAARPGGRARLGGRRRFSVRLGRPVPCRGGGAASAPLVARRARRTAALHPAGAAAHARGARARSARAAHRAADARSR